MSDRPFGVSADDIELRNQDAKNDAAVDLGAEIVELLGGGNNDVRHYGVGDYDADRTIDVHPNLSRGVGLMEKIAAYGRVGARARPIVTGRVAVDVEDAKGVGYWSRTDTLTTWSSTTGTNITLTEQSDIVTPALYAPTLVIAWGAVDLRAQVSGVQMSAAIRLFSTNTEGVPSEYTTAGGLGPFVETQADTNWHMVPLFHACRFETEFNTAILPIIRLRHSGVTSPSPANQVGDAWVGAIKIPL